MATKKKTKQKGVVVITVTARIKNGTLVTEWPLSVGFMCNDVNDKVALKGIAGQLVNVARRNVWDNAEYFGYKPGDEVSVRYSIKKMECDMFLTGSDMGNRVIGEGESQTDNTTEDKV